MSAKTVHPLRAFLGALLAGLSCPLLSYAGLLLDATVNNKITEIVFTVTLYGSFVLAEVLFLREFFRFRTPFLYWITYYAVGFGASYGCVALFAALSNVIKIADDAALGSTLGAVLMFIYMIYYFAGQFVLNHLLLIVRAIVLRKKAKRAALEAEGEKSGN